MRDTLDEFTVGLDGFRDEMWGFNLFESELCEVGPNSVTGHPGPGPP